MARGTGFGRSSGPWQFASSKPAAGDLSQVRTVVDRAWTALRDRFSASVLGTTSANAPRLDGGLSRPFRLTAAALSLLIAFAVAWATDSHWGVLVFFPALMTIGIVSGVELAVPAYLLCVLAVVQLFPEFPGWAFAAAAALQTALAVLLRVFFRESRRWGVRYRLLLGGIASAVTVSDAQGRIERPHPELEKLIGMPWPSYRGARWLKSVHPDDQKLITPSGPDVTVQRAEIRLKDPQTGEWRWHLMRAVPIPGESGEIEEWVSVLSDVHDRKLAGEQREVAVGEGRHRLKNLITIIESLAKASRPVEKDAAIEAFLVKYLGRLHALSAASDLALASNYSTMLAHDVARATLAPFLEKDSQRLTIGGPKLELSEAMGGGLAMGLNELATNAIKYGALSVPEGRVSFTWTIEAQADGDHVTMEWRENGGPPPGPPAKEGYGTRVIKFIATRESGGRTEMSYPPEGYVCRIFFTKPRRPRVRTLEGD